MKVFRDFTPVRDDVNLNLSHGTFQSHHAWEEVCSPLLLDLLAVF